MNKKITSQSKSADPTNSPSTASRRKFLKATAASVGGAAAVGFPMISRGAGTTVLKMQGSWGAGDMLEVKVAS